MTRPSVLMRPTLSRIGKLWVAEYGSHYPDNVFATGKTPAEAMLNFDRRWRGAPMKPNYYVGFPDDNTTLLKGLEQFEKDGGVEKHPGWAPIFAQDIDDAMVQAGRIKTVRELTSRVDDSLKSAKANLGGPFPNLPMGQEPYDPGD